MLNVSYLYPEVHNCCENWTLPAPLPQSTVNLVIYSTSGAIVLTVAQRGMN